jgi:hypothetical protein
LLTEEHQMNNSVDTNSPVNTVTLQGRPRDWNSHSRSRVLLAIALLVGVYLLAGRWPVAQEGGSLGLVGGFMVYWSLGSLVTVLLLAISDRGAGRS